jgi:hypothetical protein
MTFRRAAFSVIALALLGGIIFALVSIAQSPLQPEYHTHVRIMSIGYEGSKYRPLEADVAFRSEDGMEHYVAIPPAALNCKVGDVVPAIQQGVIIELAPGACNRMVLPYPKPLPR